MTTPTKTELRAAALFEQAIWGLLEYYPCFNDQTLCLECESVVKVPDHRNTGCAFRRPFPPISGRISYRRDVVHSIRPT